VLVTQGSKTPTEKQESNEHGAIDGKEWDRGLFYGTIPII
jgi:hypothetical protein